MKIYIHLCLGWNIFKVDCRVVLVLWFAEVEGELIVNGEIVVTALVHGIAEIMVLSVALLTMVTRDTLGGTETVPAPVVTQSSLSVTVTLAAVSSIDRVTKVSIAASLTMFPLGVVLARLLAHPGTGHVTRAVTVALTLGTRGEVPLLTSARARVTGNPGPGTGSGRMICGGQGYT